MKPLQNSRLVRATLLLPILMLIGCPSGDDSHKGHDHGAGQEHEDDSHSNESTDEHAGHDHDEEGSK